jgi:hypothetical protein
MRIEEERRSMQVVKMASVRDSKGLPTEQKSGRLQIRNALRFRSCTPLPSNDPCPRCPLMLIGNAEVFRNSRSSTVTTARCGRGRRGDLENSTSHYSVHISLFPPKMFFVFLSDFILLFGFNVYYLLLIIVYYHYNKNSLFQINWGRRHLD